MTFRGSVFSIFIVALGLSLSACTNNMKSVSGKTTDSSSTELGDNTDTGQTPAPTPNPTPTPNPSPLPAPPPVGPKCGMQTASSALAFCDTFDQPNPVIGRSGQLNQKVWGVSRGGLELNIGSPWPWANAKLELCNGTTVDVNSTTDIQICNGQLREGTNDNISGNFDAGGVMMMTMYVKQPFDFSGRTGTVSFDLSNDTAGSHSAWPEFWLTDQPVPLPIIHFSPHGAPANGFGVRFEASCPPGQFCSCGENDNSWRWTVGSAVVVRDWIVEDDMCDFGGASPACARTGMKLEVLGCVKQPSGPNGGLNHIELKVSQNLIEVYATDAGTTSPLKKIAIIRNANLPISRGFIWLQDKHYNADKGPADRPSQKVHTFAWDNVAFDGPLVARELSFDVLDSNVVGNGFRYLGWSTQPRRPAELTTLPIGAADLLAAKTALLMFSFYHRETPSTFTFSINGKVQNATWPFPERDGFKNRTIALPVPLSSLVMGPNKITIHADQAMEVANVNISLNGAGGIVAPTAPR